MNTVPGTAVAILPHSGELVNLDNPTECARALESIRAVEHQLREMKHALTDAVAAECSRQGTKTLHLEGVTVELSGGTKVDWDMDRLGQLRDLGLPDDRWNQLVVIEQTYRVNASVAKQIAGANDQYAHVIETARREVEAPLRVSVKR